MKERCIAPDTCVLKLSGGVDGGVAKRLEKNRISEKEKCNLSVELKRFVGVLLVLEAGVGERVEAREV